MLGTFFDLQTVFRVAGAGILTRCKISRQAQEFVRVAKTLAGVVDLKMLRNGAFRVAGARISCFVMSMFEASDAESVEGLQISCHGSLTLQ